MSEASGDAAASLETSDYNRVLEFYADAAADDIDLVELVAYALYKRQKRDWIVRHRELNGARAPTAAETRAVTTTYLTDDVRATLRERASDLLSTYAETYVEALEPRIREDAVNNETLRQARDIERAMKADSGFKRQVAVGLVSTALWTLLVTAVILTAFASGSDLVDAWIAARTVVERP